MHELDPAHSRELLAEELTSEEARDLLHRLNARDMGGSEQPTVGALVEATGCDLATVGRLLAEIRKEDFEERFGLRLDHHQRRIETLEERAQRLERAPKPTPRVTRTVEPLDHYQRAALDRLADQERQREAMRPLAYVVLAVMALVLIFALLAAGGAPQSNNPSSWKRGSPTHDGMVYINSEGDIWVETKGGARRQPTAEEQSDAAAMAIARGN